VNTPVIGFAGMTHLGINSAVATADRGFDVVCFDGDSGVIQRLKQQLLSVIEPQLPELVTKNFEKLKFTDQIKDLLACDVVYIATDVPTNDEGQSDLSEIKKLINEVSKNLSSKSILVVLCQVPPGFTRQLSFPAERLYYQVETLVFGQAVDRALNPERFIIGCSNPKKPLPVSYQTLLEAFKCPILPMRYESAELAKISINFCLVASIGVANTLSEICENIGADWSEIVPALKLDKRIGQFSYLSPGLGLAGGNLERDLTTVLELSEQHGTDTGIVSAWIKNSQYRRDWVLKILHRELLSRNQNPTIAVLGLAYKENTHSIKNSPSLALLSALTSYQVKVYDPVVSATVTPKAKGTHSAEEAIQDADVLVVMTPWAEFKTLEPYRMAKLMRGRLIVDPYGVFKDSIFLTLGFNYFSLGVSVLTSDFG
jgi:UDPglucose 6-dehydrogenase